MAKLTAPHRYTKLPGSADLVYRSICLTLSDRMDQMDWASFSPADWVLLGKMAEHEGVAPLMHWKFKRSNVSTLNVPNTIKTQLAAAYYNTAAQNQLLFNELGRILEALTDADIPVIVLKGAVLATTLYPDIALRPMGDLDLLVLPQRLETSVRIVQSMGYQKQHSTHHIVLENEFQQRMTVELHWGLITNKVNWFWEQAEHHKWVKENGTGRKYSALILSPTSKLLYLTAHTMFQHKGVLNLLLWLYDIHLLISCGENRLDWDKLIERANKFQWSAALYGALLNAQKHFGTSIPDGVLGSLADHDENLALGSVVLDPSSATIRIWSALSSLNLSTRLGMIWEILFPKLDYMHRRYGHIETWHYLYYPYRWFTMLQDIVRNIRR